MTSSMNPYQAPRVDFEPVVPRSSDFSVSSVLGEAFAVTKRYFPLWLGVGIVGLLLTSMSTLTVIGAFLLVPVFAWGGVKFLLNMVDGRAEFGDLFAGFSRYWSVVGQMLLLILIWMVLSIASNAVTFVGQAIDSKPLEYVGTAVNLVFSFTVMVRLYFAMFFMVDHGLGAVESLSASWNATRGKWGKMIWLMLVAFVVGLAGALACGIGLIFTLTLSYVMYAAAYRHLAGAPAPAY